ADDAARGPLGQKSERTDAERGRAARGRLIARRFVDRARREGIAGRSAASVLPLELGAEAPARLGALDYRILHCRANTGVLSGSLGNGSTSTAYSRSGTGTRAGSTPGSR